MELRGARRAATAAVGALLALLMLAGCSSGDSGGHDSAASDERAAGPAMAEREAAGEPAPGGAGAATDTRVEQRAIIYTGSLEVRVDDVEVAAREAVAVATRAGGFVGGDRRRSAAADAVAELELRVPADRFHPVVEELARLGSQQRRTIETQDVTEETIDLDARIATQRARVDSARRLLAQADSIGDLISLENELGRREADLASLEAKKRRLADLTALSTITVSLAGPNASTEEDDQLGFLTGLSGGWKVFLTSMTVLVTVLGAVLPWLLVFGVPLGLLWWWRRRRRGHRPTEPPLVAPVGAPPPPGVTGGGVSAAPPVPGARSAP
ncbi:DUF4349 domain-containing protein [Micromonospora sp. NPDC047134]|uniref:DUF4349 domain-containing protein n=1 Tax=Micromonospora sp. NPDC047134 TaxID=3154340 RepID=UPI0033E5A7A7